MTCFPPLELRDHTGWHWLRIEGTHVDRPYPWIADTQEWGAPIKATAIAAAKRGFTYVAACAHAPNANTVGSDVIGNEIADRVAVGAATPVVIVKRVIAAYLGTIPLDERGKQLVLFTAEKLRIGFVETIERWIAERNIATATGEDVLRALLAELKTRNQPQQKDTSDA